MHGILKILSVRVCNIYFGALVFPKNARMASIISYGTLTYKSVSQQRNIMNRKERQV
jgi:hypothetical protein